MSHYIHKKDNLFSISKIFTKTNNNFLSFEFYHNYNKLFAFNRKAKSVIIQSMKQK